MSNELVTLTQARQQCHVDDYDSDGVGPDDDQLNLCIRAASRSVLNYLDGAADAYLDSDGNVPLDSDGNPEGIPEDWQLATLFLTAEFFKNREAVQDGAVDAQFGYGYLPRPVVALLYPYRAPVLG